MGTPAASPRTSNRTSKSDEFRVIEVVKDPDGVIAEITERLRDGRVSFSIGREFDSNGSVQKTKYFSARHVAAITRLLSDLKDRLEAHEDRARAKRR